MRSGITRRWLRGSLLITVLLVLLAETMFLYNYTRGYYNSVQQTMYRRFSSVSGQLKMYTGDTVQSTASIRSMALRRMVEQFADKDKYEFMGKDHRHDHNTYRDGVLDLRTHKGQAGDKTHRRHIFGGIRHQIAGHCVFQRHERGRHCDRHRL